MARSCNPRRPARPLLQRYPRRHRPSRVERCRPRLRQPPAQRRGRALPPRRRFRRRPAQLPSPGFRPLLLLRHQNRSVTVPAPDRAWRLRPRCRHRRPHAPIPGALAGRNRSLPSCCRLSQLRLRAAHPGSRRLRSGTVRGPRPPPCPALHLPPLTGRPCPRRAANRPALHLKAKLVLPHPPPGQLRNRRASLEGGLARARARTVASSRTCRF
jgi:hypothetical protein